MILTPALHTILQYHHRLIQRARNAPGAETRQQTYHLYRQLDLRARLRHEQ